MNHEAQIARIPSNDMTRLTQVFVDSMDPSLDISVQLVSNFGGFLTLVPRRLGTNEALDAAADALITAYTRYRSDHKMADSVFLTKHSLALKALHGCLSDPIKAHSSETLCAVMLLLLCQVCSLV